MEESDWDIEGIHKMFDAQKAMTARTAKVLAVLENLNNWDSDHVAWPHEYSDVYSWEASTSTELAIRKGIQKAWLTIQKSTYGVVKYSDLRLVMSPETAAAIAHWLRASGELLCPHSAIGVKVGEDLRDPAVPMITLATAHPAKFPAAVAAATGVEPPLPPRMADLYDRPERVTRIANDLATLETHVRENRAK
jgi:threonine synthase